MNKNYFLRVRLTERERKAAELMAQDEGINLSEFIRDVIRQEAKERRLWYQVGMNHTHQQRAA